MEKELEREGQRKAQELLSAAGKEEKREKVEKALLSARIEARCCIALDCATMGTDIPEKEYDKALELATAPEKNLRRDEQDGFRDGFDNFGLSRIASLAITTFPDKVPRILTMAQDYTYPRLLAPHSSQFLELAGVAPGDLLEFIRRITSKAPNGQPGPQQKGFLLLLRGSQAGQIVTGYPITKPEDASGTSRLLESPEWLPSQGQ
ncbi:hypothetical protein BJ508DRAFT_381466 [Ascobolus immersus RN42]|uniref:Uncharacterized protein n=1 Tax=Ascobolus immersus RN42 TaxID=1160509 RepID=A0A3N4HEJ8_ASCIM|nr:hypothetical protein BJ508DRAFT_381466 [Ascobolus immersus RN42]